MSGSMQESFLVSFWVDGRSLLNCSFVCPWAWEYTPRSISNVSFPTRARSVCLAKEGTVFIPLISAIQAILAWQEDLKPPQVPLYHLAGSTFSIAAEATLYNTLRETLFWVFFSRKIVFVKESFWLQTTCKWLQDRTILAELEYTWCLLPIFLGCQHLCQIWVCFEHDSCSNGLWSKLKRRYGKIIGLWVIITVIARIM